MFSAIRCHNRKLGLRGKSKMQHVLRCVTNAVLLDRLYRFSLFFPRHLPHAASQRKQVDRWQPAPLTRPPSVIPVSVGREGVISSPGRSPCRHALPHCSGLTSCQLTSTENIKLVSVLPGPPISTRVVPAVPSHLT